MKIHSKEHLQSVLRTMMDWEGTPLVHPSWLPIFEQSYNHHFPPPEWCSTPLEVQAYIETMAGYIAQAPDVPQYGQDWSSFFYHLNWAGIFYATQAAYKYLCASRLGCASRDLSNELIRQSQYSRSDDEPQFVLPQNTARLRYQVEPHYAASNSNDVDDMMYD